VTAATAHLLVGASGSSPRWVWAALAVAATLLALPGGVPRLPVMGALRLSVRTDASSRRVAELEWVEGIAAELRAGRDPAAALVATAATSAADVCPRATAMARSGGDVVAALRDDAGGSEVLRGVGACFDVALASGAGLAASLAALADSAREAERVRDELRAGLAEPRATAAVLVALPALGLGLGSVLGADPVRWLLASTPGLVVLTAGAVLELVGAWWAWRITRSLEALL
jgi:tight adherence protein B